MLCRSCSCTVLSRTTFSNTDTSSRHAVCPPTVITGASQQRLPIRDPTVGTSGGQPVERLGCLSDRGRRNRQPVHGVAGSGYSGRRPGRADRNRGGERPRGIFILQFDHAAARTTIAGIPIPHRSSREVLSTKTRSQLILLGWQLQISLVPTERAKPRSDPPGPVAGQDAAQNQETRFVSPKCSRNARAALRIHFAGRCICISPPVAAINHHVNTLFESPAPCSV